MSDAAARERFRQAVEQPDEQINLAAAALYIAQEEYPDLDCAAYLNRLDMMAVELRDRLPPEPYPLKIIQALNHYLFQTQGFAGNTLDYYAPHNSFLNQVLDRRTGIPITLSLVYLELAGRIDFPMAGVSMPGHFLVRPTLGEMAIFVDAFHQGEILFEQDCRDRLQQLYGPGVELQPEHLQPIGPRPFLRRMLTNLKLIYLQRGDVTRSLAAIDRILLVQPDALQEKRDRGLIHYQTGNLTAARADLNAYLEAQPEATDAFEIRQLLSQIDQGRPE